MSDAKRIFDAFDLVSSACWNVQEKDGCEHCPMNNICLENKFGTPKSVVDVADLINASSWQEFLDYADECVPSDEMQQQLFESSDYDSYRDRKMGL